MSQPTEFDLPTTANASSERDQDIVTLGPDDFQRIGIQPKETRLEVIRRAASRATRSLARKQLNAPNPLTEQQLSQIAVSTYRLLDPRQRDDRQSQAYVGRIRPGALYRAGRAEFANEKILILACESSADSVSTHHVPEPSATGDVDAPAARPASAATASGMSEPRVNVIEKPARGRITHPAMIVIMIIALLMTSVAIWFWGQHQNQRPERLSPVLPPSSAAR